MEIIKKILLTEEERKAIEVAINVFDELSDRNDSCISDECEWFVELMEVDWRTGEHKLKKTEIELD